MRAVPASAAITDWIAQTPYTSEARPQAMISHIAIMDSTSGSGSILQEAFP
jgi:hypothetical protein